MGPADEDNTERDEVARRRRRSIAIACALGALVVLFFVMTLVRLGGNIGARPF